MEFVKKFATTNDGVTLEYIDEGEGSTIVLIPGGVGGPPEMYTPMINNLSHDHRVISIGSRGTGLSGRPTWGFNVFRHATDIHDVIVALGLEDVALFGYSGGQDIAFAYFELFRADRISSLILGDNPVANVFFPDWSVERALNSGSYATPAEWFSFCQMMGSEEFLTAALTENVEPMNGELLTAMCISHAGQDWMGLCTSINIPTLIIRGATSNNGTERGARWMNWAIKGSRLVIIEGDHGTALLGDGINDTVREFISDADFRYGPDRAAALAGNPQFIEPFDPDAPIQSCAEIDLLTLQEMIVSGSLSTEMAKVTNSVE
ncbi:alpha/beta hydrolase [Arthrobacter sp. MYb213]|uniref:alpha/beta fold hydrolase n=1 Tax=Arthrobacter sp. MYb213 TaxID=1848595 RepID=UPI000CFD7597|nr:alpha/beta hydrolase [Arthrobacter sp. MYb213]PRB66762.1 hypothetical protein CQ011_17065 [Arthrobacter sp. MYb213]